MTTDIEAVWQEILSASGRGGPAEAGTDIDSMRGDSRGDSFGPRDCAAADMLDCLLPLARARGSLVIGQIGQSLDGRICTESGDWHYVNGDAALVHLHRLRALVDCVLVGVGTVVADHPRLTVRRVAGPNPIRAVLDPRGRAPEEVSPLAPDAGAPKTLHLVGASCIERLGTPPAHVQRVALRECGEGVATRDVLSALASADCHRVLVEGGANTISRFVAEEALDRLHILVAPLLIGSGRPGLTLPPVQKLREAVRPQIRRYWLGDDTLFDISL